MIAEIALVLWLATAALGSRELVHWRRSSSRPPALAYRHLMTATVGLLVWTGFVVTERAWLAWTAVAVLVVNNTLGDLLTTGGWRSRHAGGTGRLLRDLGSAVGEVLRLRRPAPVVAHALLAGATFVVVVVAAVLA